MSPEEIIDRMTAHILDIAKSYQMGTPESRAIVTAIEHARILIRKDLKNVA